MIKDYETAQDFAEDFNIVDNALNMRTLDRWNGREFRQRENLSEHTHLVTACAIELYDKFKQNARLASKMCFEKIIRCAMIHDSLELLRGDILSVTKDVVPGLRNWIDGEEEIFMSNVIDKPLDELTESIVKLADLMACYKFVERELSYQHNLFARNAYTISKKKFDERYDAFCSKYLFKDKTENKDIACRFSKGYIDDAGVDVILNSDVVFMPFSTEVIDLQIQCTPKEGHMAFLCARTSAANKGLFVATCPIDANYRGTVNAIVHNISSEIITYKKGESFCQLVGVPIVDDVSGTVIVKNKGKRVDGNFGSTGR